MRYHYYPPEERKRRVFIAILIVALIVLGIILINKCSRTNPVLLENPVEIEDPNSIPSDPQCRADRDTLFDFADIPEEEPKQSRQFNTSGDWSIPEGENIVGVEGGNEYDDWDFHDNQEDEDPEIYEDPGDPTIDDTPNDPSGSGNRQSHIVRKRDNPGNNGPGSQYRSEDYEPRNVVPRLHNDFDTDGPHSHIDRDSPVGIVILVVLLIFFIIAKVISRGGILIIWATAFDKVLVIGAGILCFIAMFIQDAGGDQQMVITLYTIAGLMMLASIILSIIYNIGSLWNIFLSILAKAFVFILTLYACLAVIVILLIYFMVSAARRSRG